ncbi:hypothetical protein VYF65_003085 [Lysinibacillus irui]|uniref:hypothetical protein n=1 Tax=Lysinibacillus irui TaxID=2998077 RepID=UPI002AD3B6A2|nr:hypothetical protein [Lysinibacillus irui]MEA0565781.1 hypothetical protein [Lysinibacillus irui]
MLEQGLEQDEVIQLVPKMPSTVVTLKSQLAEEHYRNAVFNYKTLLKSFFIQTYNQSKYATLHQQIATCLNELS